MASGASIHAAQAGRTEDHGDLRNVALLPHTYARRMADSNVLSCRRRRGAKAGDLADECVMQAHVRQSPGMRLDEPLPFHGYVVWLTREQGGRDSGPPPTPIDQDYAATGFVPPATIDSGLASVVLRVGDRTAWRSKADARWLVVDNVPPHRVSEGDVIVVTEGRRVVAYFHVE